MEVGCTLFHLSIRLADLVAPAPLTARPTGRSCPSMQHNSVKTTGKLAAVFAGMLLSVFLIALDQTILAPALPVIASKFNALEQIAWIASAYFLTQVCFTFEFQ